MAVKEHILENNIRWVDVSQPTREEMDMIRVEFNLDSHMVYDCLDPDHLPKFDLMGEVHFMILRYYNHSIDKRISTIQEVSSKIAIFYTDKFLITIHRNELLFLNEVKTRIIASSNTNGVEGVVIQILWYVLDTYNDPSQRLAEQVDFYETRIFLKDVSPDQLEALYFIKRNASLCHKLLSLMLEPINGVGISETTDAPLQDVKDHHLKILTQYNQVLDDVTNLMNVHLSFSSQKTNEVMKVLTTFSVFFMPLTFIVGIYGMNFRFMPELDQKWAYPAVLILMVLIVFILFRWMKRKKWL